MISKFLVQQVLAKYFVDKYSWGEGKSYQLVESFVDGINFKESIIDIGCGLGFVSHILQRKGFNVTPVDVVNLSVINNIHPIIYDGKKLPFLNDAFDTSLLIVVLHHTPNPEQVLQEAKRVSKRLIVIEDIYANSLQRYITYFADSVTNLEFVNHPHTNKTDAEWRKIFKKLGLKIVDVKFTTTWKVFSVAIYLLEKTKN